MNIDKYRRLVLLLSELYFDVAGSSVLNKDEVFKAISVLRDFCFREVKENA